MKTSAMECQEDNASDNEEDFADILYEVEGELSEMEDEQDRETDENCEGERSDDDSTGKSDFESDDPDNFVKM